MFFHNQNDNNNLTGDNQNINKNIIEKLDKSNNQINKSQLYEEEEEEEELENDIEKNEKSNNDIYDKLKKIKEDIKNSQDKIDLNNQEGKKD